MSHVSPSVGFETGGRETLSDMNVTIERTLSDLNDELRVRLDDLERA